MEHIHNGVYIATKEDLFDFIQTNYANQTVIVLSGRAADRYQLTESLSMLMEVGAIIWIHDFASNPTQQDILNGLTQIGDYTFRSIVAIGGGSAIDLAKGILAMHQSFCHVQQHGRQLSTEDITNAITNHSYSIGSDKEIIAIPTTAGTGSEVTAWATIWGCDGHSKYSVDRKELIPSTVYLIPELTLTLPIKETLSTGLDALSHAMEAYWARATNPSAKQYSLQAVKAILQYLPEVLKQPDNLYLRKEMLIASYTAGLAFAQTRTTACHSISYPLTYLYAVEHGFAVALTLPQIAMINQKEVPDIEQLLDLFTPYGGMGHWLQLVTDGIVTLKLSNWGITGEDIPVIADASFTKGRMDNNPVAFSKKDVEDILYNLL